MSKTNEFWQYAKEALLLASEAKTDDDRQRFLDLASTWTQAALVERRSPIDDSAVAYGRCSRLPEMQTTNEAPPEPA
jgi:hypothetical protein